jgi:hypothetical protein
MNKLSILCAAATLGAAMFISTEASARGGHQGGGHHGSWRASWRLTPWRVARGPAGITGGGTAVAGITVGGTVGASLWRLARRRLRLWVSAQMGS